MKNISATALTFIFTLIAISSFAQSKSKYDQTIIKRASVEFNCPAEKIVIKNGATYRGGGLFVVQVCDSTVYYECMGTVCQLRCNYQPKSTTETGSETNGRYHQIVLERATVEFDCPATEIKQLRHSDGLGQGFYVLSVCGKEVQYECMGSVCNLKCSAGK